MNVGIDASNLRSGGGMTYVVELLAHADPARHGIDKVMLWASAAMLARTAARPWLERVHVPAFEGKLPRRIAWQLFERSRLARQSCDVLFAPGATPVGSFRPQVSMSTNMLPFAPEESARYGWTRDRVRFALLRAQQALALRRSSAVIFLTDYARARISSLAGLPDAARTDVIASGVNERFRSLPRTPRPLASYSAADPFRFLYVSDIHPYKHQWNVVEAVARLHHAGLPVALDIIGSPTHPRSARQLAATLSRLNGAGDAIRFRGPIAHDDLPPIYREAGAFLFASTCENLPMTLVEAMASGLPIAASRTRPMPDILGEAQIAFDPESVPSIEQAVRTLATDHERRGAIAQKAYDAAARYSWDECSDRTFALLAEVARGVKR
ncbi:MAG TPA: glycosyltransferase family 1 protein [Thermoanaerobaculia bacterium]|nr:glycosyltransferase family 1 protein [Thermoanaerobaculia bacterium]